MLSVLESMRAQPFIDMVKGYDAMVQEDPALKELLDGDKVAEVVEHLQQKKYAGNRDAELALTCYDGRPYRTL